jgi:hypothetical protein
MRLFTPNMAKIGSSISVIEYMTFSEVGKYLELGSRSGKASTRRQNMTLFGKILESESKRFHVFDSETQKGAKMVCLTSEYFTKGKRV